MRPQCRITVDDKLVSGTFMSRLVSCEVTDKKGVSADTVSIVLNDDPPAETPRTGALIRVWMGYGVSGLVFMGAFTAEEIEVEILPYRMNIKGKAAEMRGKVKENRERHFEDKTLREIATQVAADHGLTAKVDEAIGSFRYDWLGQQNESDIHFMERLADRHDAVFSVKDGNLILAANGTGKSPGGADLTPIIVTPQILQPGSCRVRFSDRTSYKSAKASYTDRDLGEKVDVEEDSDDRGTAIYRLGEQFAGPEEAKRAAKAKAQELKRRQTAFSCTIVGDPSARGGAPLQFRGCRRDVDGVPMIVETAAHRFSAAGYTTALDGNGRDAKPSGSTSSSSSSPPANVPIPTPAPR